MSEEIAEPKPDWIARLDKAKDYAPLALLGAAFIYAIGWLLESIGIEYQGVGMWDIGHQQAVIAALGWLASIFVLMLIGPHGSRFFHSLQKWRTGCLFASLAYGVVVCCGMFYAVAFQKPLFGAVLIYGVIFFTQIAEIYDDRPSYFTFKKADWFKLLIVCNYFYLYGQGVIPQLPASLGGFPRSRVIVYGTDSKAPVYSGQMLGGDSDSIVIESLRRRIRITKKEIGRIESFP